MFTYRFLYKLKLFYLFLVICISYRYFGYQSSLEHSVNSPAVSNVPNESGYGWAGRGNSCVEWVSTYGSGLDGPVGRPNVLSGIDGEVSALLVAVEAIPTSIVEAELQPPRL